MYCDVLNGRLKIDCAKLPFHWFLLGRFMYRNILLVVAIALLIGCSEETVTPMADMATQRVTPSGTAVGFTNEHAAHVWRGLPFAKAPVDELRWRAPVASEPWQGSREFVEFAHACAQPNSQIGGANSDKSFTGDEDCLYLDIYAPAMNAEQAAQAKLPVMVWIHGGGNSIGTSASYDGSLLAQQENVIVVAVQYRLGPFGWFYNPELAGDNATPEDSSGNYGTLDLIESLKWVQQNIASFGGDAENVTIFGESAGGYNVFSLLISPLAENLFHRAISQSGSVHFADTEDAMLRLPNGSVAVTQRMMESAQLHNELELRTIDTEAVLAAYTDTSGSGMLDMPTVLHDGHVVPKPATLALLQSAQYNRVPVMMGTNKDETKLFQYLDPYYTDTWLGIWSRAKNPQVYERDAWYQSAHWRLMGAELPARAMNHVTRYVYRFEWDELGSPLWMDFPLLFGAAHAFEIPFVFGGVGGLGPLDRILDSTPEPQQREELSRTMMRYWGNFARNGNPNSTDLPEWPAWSGQGSYLIFDSENGGGVRTSSETLTVAGLAAKLDSDNSFDSPQKRCDLYDKLQKRGKLISYYRRSADCE